MNSTPRRLCTARRGFREADCRSSRKKASVGEDLMVVCMSRRTTSISHQVRILILFIYYDNLVAYIGQDFSRIGFELQLRIDEPGIFKSGQQTISWTRKDERNAIDILFCRL